MKDRKGEGGFTLLELLISLTIFAVALLGLAQLQATGIKTNSQANTQAVATALAQSVFEELERLPGDDPFFAAPAKVDAAWPASPVSVPGGGDYTISYSTTPGFNGVSNITRVEIAVRSQHLQSLTRNNKTVTLTALKRTF